MPQVPWPSTGTTSPEGNAVVRMPRAQFVSLVVIPTASPIGTITNANCAKTQASSLSSVSSLHPPDWPIASRVCFQRQFIWIVLFFASWSEVLPHDVVLRRPTIITLASQRSLTNPIVSYFVDLEARHIAHLADTEALLDRLVVTERCGSMQRTIGVRNHQHTRRFPFVRSRNVSNRVAGAT